MNYQDHQHDHDEIRELLPWFVNGTLNEDQQSAVSEHLEECRTCRDDVDELVRIAARFTVPAQTDLADHSREAALAFTESLPAQTSSTAQATQRTGALVGLACAVLVAGFIGIFTLMPQDLSYRTLSRTDTAADKAVIQVVFSERATEREIRHVLVAEGQRVVSGPTAQGVYRIALDKELDPRIRLARLRDSDAVIFAEMETLP